MSIMDRQVFAWRIRFTDIHHQQGETHRQRRVTLGASARYSANDRRGRPPLDRRDLGDPEQGCNLRQHFPERTALAQTRIILEGERAIRREPAPATFQQAPYQPARQPPLARTWRPARLHPDRHPLRRGGPLTAGCRAQDAFVPSPGKRDEFAIHGERNNPTFKKTWQCPALRRPSRVIFLCDWIETDEQPLNPRDHDFWYLVRSGISRPSSSAN